MKVKIKVYYSVRSQYREPTTYVVDSGLKLFDALMKNRHRADIKLFEVSEKDGRGGKNIAHYAMEFGDICFKVEGKIYFEAGSLADHEALDTFCGQLWERILSLPVAEYDRTNVVQPAQLKNSRKK